MNVTQQAREVLLNLWRAPGLKERIAFTFAMLALFRFGVYVPISGVDHGIISKLLGSGGLGSFLNLFSGGALGRFSIFALGITPYINASIIMQLMESVFPKLEELRKEGGEQGRKELAQYTRYLTIALSLIQAVGICSYIWRSGAVLGHPASGTFPIFFFSVNVPVLICGAMFIMWMGELITENGIGNGASLLIMLSIISRIPFYFKTTGEAIAAGAATPLGVALLIAAFVLILVAIVIVQEGERKIPITAARKQVAGRMVHGRSSYIPFKVNLGGVMPIIFAASLLLLPVTLAQFLGAPKASLKPNWIPTSHGFFTFGNFGAMAHSALFTFLNALAPSGWLYIAFYFALIVFFTYFYATLVFNPEEVAENLKKHGNFIPGVKPGKPTSEFLTRLLNRVTFIGALFLGLVALAPSFVERATGVTTLQGLGSTSLLILVGVAVDLYNQLQTHLIARQYEGFMR